MIPVSVTGVIVFFLFVAPGTCYELLRSRTLHPREESTFLQISRVLLSGTLFTAAALGVLVMIHVLAPAVLIDLPALLTGGVGYIAGHAGQVGLTLLLQLVFASLIAVIANDLRTAPDASVITQGTLWHALTERLRPGLRAYLSVRLKNGGEVTGFYVGASTDLEPAKREILVGEPLAYRSPGATEAESLAPEWGAMIISGSEIEYLVVSHVGEAIASTKPRLHQRVQLWLARHIFSWWLSAAAAILVFVATVYLGNPVIRLVFSVMLTS